MKAPSVAYVDSSVLLRLILGETGQSSELPKQSRLISSELLRLECLRAAGKINV